MSQQGIPQDEQIDAMVHGTTLDLSVKYFGQRQYDFKTYLSVTKTDLEAYFRDRPRALDDWHARHVKRRLSSDRYKLDTIDGSPAIVYLEDGRAKIWRSFDTLAKGAAVMILVEHGMYKDDKDD